MFFLGSSAARSSDNPDLGAEPRALASPEDWSEGDLMLISEAFGLLDETTRGNLLDEPDKKYTLLIESEKKLYNILHEKDTFPFDDIELEDLKRQNKHTIKEQFFLVL